MFIKKILQSQKRIQYTIDEFVKDKGLDKDEKLMKKIHPVISDSTQKEETSEIEKRIFGHESKKTIKATDLFDFK